MKVVQKEKFIALSAYIKEVRRDHTLATNSAPVHSRTKKNNCTQVEYMSRDIQNDG